MSQVEIIAPDGRSITIPEERVRTLWDEGKLNDSYTYRKDGVSEPLPIRELITKSPTTNNQSLFDKLQSRNIERYRFVKDPTILTRCLQVVLFASLAATAISAVANFAQLELINSLDLTDEAVDANDRRQAIASRAVIGSLLVTIVTYLMWVRRASVNCHGFGAPDMEFTPGWAVGWYAVPIANLFKPYQVMKEIWQVSTNPANWKSEDGSVLLGIWWALWLLTNVIGQIAARLRLRAQTIDALQVSTVIDIIYDFVNLAAHIAVFLVITSIYRRQRALVDSSTT